jgi:hypothetical protein
MVSAYIIGKELLGGELRWQQITERWVGLARALTLLPNWQLCWKKQMNSVYCAWRITTSSELISC